MEVIKGKIKSTHVIKDGVDKKGNPFKIIGVSIEGDDRRYSTNTYSFSESELVVGAEMEFIVKVSNNNGNTFFNLEKASSKAKDEVTLSNGIKSIQAWLSVIAMNGKTEEEKKIVFEQYKRALSKIG